MSSKIQLIPLDNLTPHPDNPNKMSKATFAKLVRNIERTGRYEPLIVRRNTDKQGCSRSKAGNLSRNTDKSDSFQIINGHHRWLALKHLGYKTADAIVWDVDDGEADILLATLNRLCGQDVLDKKIALLKQLNEKMQPAELAKLLPQTKTQLEKLTQLTISDCRMSIEKFESEIENRKSKIFLNPLIFFVSDGQQQVIETALEYFLKSDKTIDKKAATLAAKRASALSVICRYYLDHKQ